MRGYTNFTKDKLYSFSLSFVESQRSHLVHDTIPTLPLSQIFRRAPSPPFQFGTFYTPSLPKVQLLQGVGLLPNPLHQYPGLPSPIPPLCVYGPD